MARKSAGIDMAVMLTRPAGHEAKAEAEARKSEDGAEAQNFFRGRGQTPRHVREQLSAYEHEEWDIGVQNIVFSKQPIHNRNDCRWLYCEY